MVYDDEIKAKEDFNNLVDEVITIDNLNKIYSLLKNKLDYIDINNKFDLYGQTKYFLINSLLEYISSMVNQNKPLSFIKINISEFKNLNLKLTTELLINKIA